MLSSDALQCKPESVACVPAFNLSSKSLHIIGCVTLTFTWIASPLVGTRQIPSQEHRSHGCNLGAAHILVEIWEVSKALSGQAHV